jgi:nitric oxide reductase subunit B
MALGFTVLIWLAARTYVDAPPIPIRVVGPGGGTIFTREDILAGQQVFLRYGLMENGTVWGHGAYLGPDFSAASLHTLALEAGKILSKQRFGRPAEELSEAERAAVGAEVRQLLKQNRYDPRTGVLTFTDVEEISCLSQVAYWMAYFSRPAGNGGLPADYIKDPVELRQLTSFFCWTAWASVAVRPGRSYSYTNNFPYDPQVGNLPTSDAILWSALSLIPLLAGTALVLLAFGRFDYLGWKGKNDHIHPQMLPGLTTQSQRATIKYFVIASLLFLVQVLVGGATAHYRADPAAFYGVDISSVFPSHILRTWHLQLAIFWIATSYIAGGLLLAPAIGNKEPRGQAGWINLLFGALVVVVAGSLLGEALGVNQMLGKLWFWFGHQGWEYLDLGRAWQVLLAAALALWLRLLFRAIGPGAERSPVS